MKGLQKVGNNMIPTNVIIDLKVSNKTEMTSSMYIEVL